MLLCNRLVKLCCVLVVCGVMSACGSVTIRKEEALWQTINLADTIQTYNMVGSCYHEANKGTSAVIGKHPSKGRIALWSLFVGVGHYFVSDHLYKEEKSLKYKPAYTAWQVLTTAFKVKTVYDNEQIGMGVDGVDCD